MIPFAVLSDGISFFFGGWKVYLLKIDKNIFFLRQTIENIKKWDSKNKNFIKGNFGHQIWICSPCRVYGKVVYTLIFTPKKKKKVYTSI